MKTLDEIFDGWNIYYKTEKIPEPNNERFKREISEMVKEIIGEPNDLSVATTESAKWELAAMNILRDAQSRRAREVGLEL